MIDIGTRFDLSQNLARNRFTGERNNGLETHSYKDPRKVETYLSTCENSDYHEINLKMVFVRYMPSRRVLIFCVETDIFYA